MSFHIRLMTPVDIQAGLRLKDIAGWNQTREDWERFLKFNPDGCFVAEHDGQVAGTVATIVYEDRLAWIGMVLVDPDQRGQGIGTALLHEAIAHLDARRIPCIKLDATPQGKQLYERFGFKVEYEIDRWTLQRTAGSSAPSSSSNTDVEAIVAIDRDVFGADRGQLLRSVAAAAPELVVLARRAENCDGYALGRRGSLADHLGPWIARDEQTARAILRRFLEHSQRATVFVDVLRDNSWARTLVREEGFDLSRPLTRMYRGENVGPGRTGLMCAILGPEFG